MNRLSRRSLLKGMIATAAGVLIPEHVAAEPERRIWALDSTMIEPQWNNRALRSNWDADWFSDEIRVRLYDDTRELVSEWGATRNDAGLYEWSRVGSIKLDAQQMYSYVVIYPEAQALWSDK
jgi:hypothetical protein